MKGISAIVIILGVILILGLIFVSSNLHLPRACTEEAKRCQDGSYVGRDPYNNCEFRPCPSGTTTTITTTTGQCGGWPGGLPEPYMPRIGGQKENYAVGETVTLDLYLKNNPRCEGGQWVNRNLTLNTLSFSVDVERIISPPIPSTKEHIISEVIQSASVGPVVVPSGTEIKVGQWTWNQKDSQGKQVGEGIYEIIFITLDPNIHTSIATLITLV
jgi:hypothetical protein